MQDLARLSDFAKCEIDELLKDGIQPTPEEIVELNALGWACESPSSRRALSRGIPVSVGGVHLWPMTLQGIEWVERVREEFRDDLLTDKAAVYAMAHAYEPGALDVVDGNTKRTINRWFSLIPARQQEVTEAAGQVIAQDEPDFTVERWIERNDGFEKGDLVAFLTSAVGGPPEVWERLVSASYVNAQIRAHVAQNRAEGKGAVDDSILAATRAIGLRLMKIRERANG